MFLTGCCGAWMNEPDRAETTFSALQESLRRVAAEAGDLPEVLNNLAIARSRLGKLEPAQEDLRRAADLDPDESDYLFNLGLIALRASNLDEAVTEVRQDLQRENDDTKARARRIFSLHPARA